MTVKKGAEFLNNIKTLMVAKKIYTQKDLVKLMSEKCGYSIHTSTVSLLLSGKRSLDLNWIEKFALALDCNIEDIKQTEPINSQPDNKTSLPKEIVYTVQEMVMKEKGNLSHKKQLEIALKTLYCLMQDFKPEAITKDVILATMKGISFGE